MWQQIAKQFQSQDPISYIIAAILAVGIVIIFERIIFLQIIYRINFSKFNTSLRKMLASGDLERARSFCVSTSHTGVPLIATKAIDAYQSDAFKVRMVVSEEMLQFTPNIRRHTGQLPNLATAAILLGAVGTLHGLWEAFMAADSLEMGLKSYAFSFGVTQALSPLGLALLSVVFMILPYGFLEGMAARLEGEVEHSVTIVLNILAPETQAIVAAQTSFGTASNLGGSAPAQGETDTSSNNEKGSSDDMVIERTSEQIPDEEEII